MRKFRLFRLLCFLLVAALLGTSYSYAANPNCSFTAGGVVSFGNYDPSLATDNTSNSTLTIKCTGLGNLTGITVNISLGVSSVNNSFNPRQMQQTPAAPVAMNYNLYIDPALTQIWGDGTNGTYINSQFIPNHNGTATGVVPVYGDIPAKQNTTPGSYLDTLTATFTY